ncbi:MAG TPA: aminotransferase class I/II-fold pyridoxal phosphate-dependent enzyme [Planctomycetota bacterium]|nr:aminotransferase class I/II-fold pyridoxal phosphate-dependent enzyme [Planctomycetota bacterium]
MRSTLEREASSELARLEAAGLRRRIDAPSGIDFASNDYLGLARDARVIAAARAALEETGVGATAARLLRGDHPAHRALELRLAAVEGAEDGLLFPSGFHANLGVLQTLGREGWVIVSDARNHASIIEGCRRAPAEVVVVPHNDVEAVDRAVRHDRTIVVTEAVFSMAGDLAPVEEISAVCARRGAALIVDEAHALGLLPARGAATLRVNPCGKALGGAGAVVTGPRVVLDLLRSTCRSFLFTTAPPPAVAAAVLAALGVAEAEPWRAQRALDLARRVDPAARSCIVPVRCESNESALRAQARLRELGLDVRAVRPPTVPHAMLRLSIHADRTDAEVERLRTGLEEVLP